MSSRQLALILSFGIVACATTAPTTAPAPQPTPPAKVAASAAPIVAEIIAAGGVGPVKPTGRVAALGTLEGSVTSLASGQVPSILPGGTTIQARLGTRFGCQVLVKGAAQGSVVPLRTRVTHPPITNPATGKSGTVDVWDSPMNAGIVGFAGWGFDNRWELVAGSWKIEILDGERPIAEQQFTITLAESSGAPERER